LKSELIAGPAGALEILCEHPDAEPSAVAVICHPHPLHGGSLSNKIVHQLARTFGELGALSLRFNFRGVGRSEGVYDGGRGELDDLLAVVSWADERWPALPLWLGGFSFGGIIAVRGAQLLQPQRLVTVAPAVNYFSPQAVALAATDWLVIQGDADDVVPAVEVRHWLERADPRPSLAILEGAGHFLHGRLNELRQVIVDAYS
jgi:alpha/beta superfamily hydrolase